jgi:tetratricopeptide (TPR) repeat protein
LQLAREKRTRAEANRETWVNALKVNLPRETPDQSVNELTSSLKDLVPDQFKSFLGFIGGAFPRRGIRVMSDLQRQNDRLGKLGISFEMEDMRNAQERELYTIWEPTTEDATVGDPQAPSTVPAAQSLPSCTEPPAEEAEATALCKLGALYEEDGDLEQAKSRYEDALKKQPTSVEARGALRRVLEKDHTLVERYNALLDPAVRWLALQIDRRGWLAKEIPSREERDRYLGKVYNYFGVLYQGSGPAYGSCFYQLAVEDFERAIKHCEDWHVPYMQLAVTYSFIGREGQSHRCDVLQRKALREYEKALQRLGPRSTKIAKRVKVGRAIVKLLMRDDVLKDEAVQEIERIEESENVIEKLLRTKQRDIGLLYNLACYYSMAYGQKANIADAKEISLLYLTYSLARDRQRKLWDWADHDPDLKPIRDNIAGGLPNLKDELSMLPERRDENYGEALRVIPRRITWTKEATEGLRYSRGWLGGGARNNLYLRFWYWH